MKQRTLSWVLVASVAPLLAEAQPAPVHVRATSLPSAREWSQRLDTLLASRDLVVRLVRNDTMIPGRQHERLAQLHDGVPVFGGELIRQSDASGTLTVFGTFYDDIDVQLAPKLGPADVESRLAGIGGRSFGRRGGPELVVLPLEIGGYRLAYRTRAFFSEPIDIRQIFFDAGGLQAAAGVRLFF